MNKYERAVKKFEDAGAIVSSTSITSQPFTVLNTDVSTVAALRTSMNDLIRALGTAGVLIVEEPQADDIGV